MNSKECAVITTTILLLISVIITGKITGRQIQSVNLKSHPQLPIIVMLKSKSVAEI